MKRRNQPNIDELRNDHQEAILDADKSILADAYGFIVDDNQQEPYEERRSFISFMYEIARGDRDCPCSDD